MKLTDRLFDDSTDRAVSPVIGVILMVAITVILAAVIGTFVLNLSDQTGSAGPNAQMSVSDADESYNTSGPVTYDFVQISHNSGGDVDADSVRVVLRDNSDNSVLAEWEDGSWTANTTANNSWRINLNGDVLTGDDAIGTGDIVTINTTVGGHALNAGVDYRVQVIHPESEKQLINSVVEVN